MQKQIINSRQIAWLTGSLLTGGGLISVQNVLFRISRTDTWLAYVLPTVYVFVVIALFGYLSKTFPQKQIYEILFELFGKWVGGILNAVLIVHIYVILIRDMSSLSRFFNTTILPRTPLEILTLLFVLVLIYYGRTSLEVVARVNDIFFPLFMMMAIVMPIALLNEIHISSIQPIMATSFWRFITSNTIASSWYADIFIMGAFLHMIYNTKELKAGLRRGVLLATFILTFTLFTEIAVFGPFLPGNFIYPSYSLVQQIHITDFLDRLDLLMLMIWFPTTTCKIITIYFALLIGLASYSRKKDTALLNKPVAMLMLITSLAAFRSTTEVFSFGNYSSTAIFLSYQPLYIVLLYVGTKLFIRRRERSGQSGPARELPEQGSGGSLKSRNNGGPLWERISLKYPYSFWTKFSNAILTGLVVLTVIGFLGGRRWSLIGNASGLLYLIGLALLMLATFAEVKTTQQRG